MTTFVNTAIIDASIEQVYSFLEDFNNHKQLQPDTVYNWNSTRDRADFTIKNMADLALKIENRKPNSEILILPAGNVPFDVSLEWELKSLGAKTEVILAIKADLNMMMKMIASSPLQKLVDFQIAKINELLS